MEVGKCSEIGHVFWNVIFLVHQCDVKGCKEYLVSDGNFDNNMQFWRQRKVGVIPLGWSEQLE